MLITLQGGGAEVFFNRIRTSTSNEDIQGLLGSHSGELSGNDFDVTVVDVNDDLDTLEITSTGFVGNQERTVELLLVRGDADFPWAIFGDIVLNLGGAPTEVHGGDVGTNLESINDVSGNVVFFPDTFGVQVDQNYVLDPIDESKFPEENRFDNISGAGNTDVFKSFVPYIEKMEDGVSHGYARIGSINSNGNYKIEFNGADVMNLLIEDAFTLGGNNTLTHAEGTILNIFFLGDPDSDSDKIVINGNLDVSGIIYAPNSQFEVAGGGNGTLHGSNCCTKNSPERRKN